MSPYRQTDTRLGPFVRDYRRLAPTHHRVTVAALRAVLSIVPVAFALLLGLIRSDRAEAVVAAAAGVSALGALVLLASRLVERWARSDSVRLHVRGLVLRRFGVDHAVPLSEIVSIRSSLERCRENGPISHWHRIEIEGGKALRIGSEIERVAELMSEVRLRSGQHRLERACAGLATGSIVSFGPIRMTAHALAYDGFRPIRLAALDAPEIANGHLLLWAKGRTRIVERIPCSQVANLDILLVLIDERRARERS